MTAAERVLFAERSFTARPVLTQAGGRAGPCRGPGTLHPTSVSALPPAALPVADVDALLPHGVEKHGDAVQGLRGVRHGHSGARSAEAEE